MPFYIYKYKKSKNNYLKYIKKIIISKNILVDIFHFYKKYIKIKKSLLNIRFGHKKVINKFYYFCHKQQCTSI